MPGSARKLNPRAVKAKVAAAAAATTPTATATTTATIAAATAAATSATASPASGGLQVAGAGSAASPSAHAGAARARRQRLSATTDSVESKLALNYGKTRVATPKQPRARAQHRAPGAASSSAPLSAGGTATPRKSGRRGRASSRRQQAQVSTQVDLSAPSAGTLTVDTSTPGRGRGSGAEAASSAASSDATSSDKVSAVVPKNPALRVHLETKVNMREKFAQLKKAGAGPSTPHRKLNPGSVKQALKRKLESKIAERDAIAAGKPPPAKPAPAAILLTPRHPSTAVAAGSVVRSASTVPVGVERAAGSNSDSTTDAVASPRRVAEQNLLQKYGAGKIANAYGVFDMATAEGTLRQEQRAALERCHLEAKTRAAQEMRRMRHRFRRLLKEREIPMASGFEHETDGSAGNPPSASTRAAAAAALAEPAEPESSSVRDRHGAPVPALLGSDMARALLPPDLVEHFESKVQQKHRALFRQVKLEYEMRKREAFEAGQQSDASGNFVEL